MNWKVPDFSNEEEILNRFNNNDRHNMQTLKNEKKDERRLEQKLDKILEE
jgi:hypothetical protein